MQFRSLLSVGALALVLQGCASLSGDECLVADWYAVGYADGARGASAETIGRHRKACAKHGVAPDLSAYRSGRDSGLREFCQPANGFAAGSSGRFYPSVCPSDLDGPFLEAYRAGRKLHDLEASIALAERGIVAKRKELVELREELRVKEAALVGAAATPVERVTLLDETREMAERQGTLESEILELERDKAVRTAALLDYRATLAYNY